MDRRPPRVSLSLATAFLLTFACSDRERLAPSAVSTATEAEATRPDGVTLKIDAPVLSTPSDNTLWSSGNGLVFTVRHVKGRYANFPVSYEVEVRNGGGTVLATGIAPQATTGSTTSVPIRDLLDASTPVIWRARARHDSAVGPWSPPRTLTLQRLVRMDGGGGLFDVGDESTPRVEIVQQGEETDCTDRAQFSSSNPQVLAIAGRTLRAIAIGNAVVRADCDGITGLTRDVRVRELWEGTFTPRECVRTFGTFDRCQFSMRVLNLRLELSQSGANASGVLTGIGASMPVTGSTSGSNSASLTGKAFACGLGTADDEYEWYDLTIDRDRGTLAVGYLRQSEVFLCTTVETKPPASRWIVTGDVTLHR